MDASAGAGDPSRLERWGFPGDTLLDPAGELLRFRRRRLRVADWDWASFGASAGALERHARRPLLDSRVLDLGCGRRFPATLLFHSFGARATGIDLDAALPPFAAGVWIGMVRRGGPGRLAGSLLRKCLFDPGYYRELRRRAGRSLRFEGLDLRLMDAGALDFPDAEFDLVHSNSVFEHLRDVPGAVREVARVLKPAGVASIVIHLYPSLSGGHHPEWAFPAEEPSQRVPPWDHLRANRFPAGPYLNGWRERDYRPVIGERFEILEEERFTEGEGGLTPELERELSAYSRSDLTTRALRLVLRKRAPPSLSRGPWI